MPQHRSNFSLASLFLLVACFALMLAATRSAVMQWKDKDVALAWVAAGVIVGALTGTIIGLGTPRWFRGGFIGFATGAVAGGMAGAQLGGPPEMFIVLIGVVTLVLLSAALRPKTTADSPESQGPGNIVWNAAESPRESVEP